MTDSPIPADDPRRQLTVVQPDGDQSLRHIALAGNIYTVLVSGDQTDGRYTLIDMRVSPGGGPPPHRHDFEEMFTVMEGQIQFTFRGREVTVHAGGVVNIPANAPHFFRNVSGQPARMLCMCTPAGQEEYFLEIGDPVAGPAAPQPVLSETEKAARRAKAVELAARYRSEFL